MQLFEHFGLDVSQPINMSISQFQPENDTRSLGKYCVMQHVTCTTWLRSRDLYRVTCTAWLVLWDLYSVTCTVWLVLCDLYRVTCTTWLVSRDFYHVTCTAWLEPRELYRVTCTTWLVSRDLYHVICIAWLTLTYSSASQSTSTVCLEPTDSQLIWEPDNQKYRSLW